MHVRAMVEVLQAARWTTIDFRESTTTAAAGMGVEMEKTGQANTRPTTIPKGGVQMPGMGAQRLTERPRLNRRMSTSEMGASGSKAAAAFMSATRESLMFYVSKIRWPVELATDSQEGKLDACNRRYCAALIELMDGTRSRGSGMGYPTFFAVTRRPLTCFIATI